MNLFSYDSGARILRRVTDADIPGRSADVVWWDLVNPTTAELEDVSRVLGVEMPSRAAREEIEASSRIYSRQSYHFLTCILPVNSSAVAASNSGDSLAVANAPVTFVKGKNVLVTIRNSGYRAFDIFTGAVTAEPLLHEHGPVADWLLVSLLEHIVDRMADRIESASHAINSGLSETFVLIRQSHDYADQQEKHRERLGNLAVIGVEVSKMRESLLTISRLTSYLPVSLDPYFGAHVGGVARDVRSLSDQLGFLSEKLSFMLNAILGAISIEQNNSARVFSTVSVLFLPPMFIASVYGMNFHRMPELDWQWGYAGALVMMLFSAVVAYLVFRGRRFF